jgi:hypothetical protein
MTFRLLALVSLLIPATLVSAQSERVTVRMAPAPNQTLHLRTTQDMAMTTETSGDGSAPFSAMAVKLHNVVDVTSAVGPTDNKGHYTAKMTIDSIVATATMNGRELPLPMVAAEAAKQVITFSYDDQGKVIDVSLDDSSGGAPAEMLKQIMTRAFATVEPMTLSVGESVTVPTALNLPLPAGGPAAPMGIQGETHYTLTSVTFDGADRIAHLSSHTTNTINRAPPSPPPAGSPFALALTMTADGKSDVNVDRGIVLHAEQQGTIEAAVGGPTTEQKTPNVRMRGTFTIVSDFVK